MPVVGSIPIVPRKIPKAPERSPLIIESPTREMTRVMPSAIREKYSGGPKRMAKAASGGARSIRPMHAQRPGDEGADRRYPQRRAGPAVLAHLVAVEAGHDGGGLARQVHQDGGRRTAVHGPVVDAGKHDDGGRGVHPEGEGDEHGRPGNGPDAGENADDRPHRHAEEAVEKVGEGKGRRETVKQVFEHDSSLLYIPRNPVGRGDFNQRRKIA